MRSRCGMCMSTRPNTFLSNARHKHMSMSTPNTPSNAQQLDDGMPNIPNKGLHTPNFTTSTGQVPLLAFGAFAVPLPCGDGARPTIAGEGDGGCSTIREGLVLSA